MIPKIIYLAFIICFMLFCDTLKAKKYPSIEEEQKEAIDFIVSLNEQRAKNAQRLALADWTYDSDMTNKNLENTLTVLIEVEENEKEFWEMFKKFNWQRFSNYSLKRQFQKYSVLGSEDLPNDKYMKLSNIIDSMELIFSKAKICPLNKEANNNCNLNLNTDLSQILSTSRDPETLKHVWLEWRNAVGPKCRKLYEEYVNLSNEAARLGNFKDASEYWLNDYEDPSFKNQVEELWQQLKPLYLQIHAYVRTKLREKYGAIVSTKGPIPAHLLGNMWAQSWVNILQFTLPYPNAKSVQITEQLKKQNYTAKKIFQTAETFFKSINLSEMPETFWANSILEKPPGRDLICHASSSNFYDGKDFRIKQCTQITEEHFITAHHEMGHVQYFMQYKDQPYIFQDGANDGFHEAIGDLVALSVQSMKHLKKIGLLPSDKDDSKQTLNNLFKGSPHLACQILQMQKRVLGKRCVIYIGHIMNLHISFSPLNIFQNWCHCAFILQLLRCYIQVPKVFVSWETHHTGTNPTTGNSLVCLLHPPIFVKYRNFSGYRRKFGHLKPEKLGLDKIAFLPFGYLTDLWRWEVFSGKTTPENYNCRWWQLREKYQGIEPPVNRSEADFDPAAKYHIVADVPYLRYFISFVLQYQFHRALCTKAGEYKPNDSNKQLHDCNIFGNIEAGNVLKKMLAMGSSRPWPDALEVVTGQRTMDATSILEYFEPLQKWLVRENRKNKVFIGWEPSKKGCSGTSRSSTIHTRIICLICSATGSLFLLTQVMN